MSQQKFRIGITMAGAVSAGAYTAGAMDYLIEVLEKWEKAKAQNREIGKDNPGYDETIPMHDVEIPIFSGASAGGITAVITSAAVQQNIPPVIPTKRNDTIYKSQNLFYHTWVDLIQDDMVPLLFDNSDIDHGKEVDSLLNAQFVEALANRVVKSGKYIPYPRPYLSERLEIMVSLSNLKGIPFDIGFRSEADRTNFYHTCSYRDYGHFVLAADYNNDGCIPVSYTEDINLKPLRQSAMATGAFPIGLAARNLTRSRKFIQDNKYINPLCGKPDYNLQIDDPYETLNADGGMLNNEPFDVTDDILLDKTGQSREESKHHNTFKSTVLMIDPFPSEPVPEGVKEKPLRAALFAMAGELISTMRGELSFKRDSLEVAFEDDNYSRFLIAPSRYDGLGKNYQGSHAIACGSLGGFGGFFEKSFREHDYYLGRRNTQRFLRQHFCIPKDTTNPLFNDFGNTARERFSIKFTGDQREYIPIIPDLGYDKNDLTKNIEPEAAWPKFDSKRFKEIESLVKTRLEKVILAIAELNWFFNVLAWIGIRIFRNKVADKVVNTIQEDFKKRDLLN